MRTHDGVLMIILVAFDWEFLDFEEAPLHHLIVPVSTTTHTQLIFDQSTRTQFILTNTMRGGDYGSLLGWVDYDRIEYDNYHFIEMPDDMRCIGFDGDRIYAFRDHPDGLEVDGANVAQLFEYDLRTRESTTEDFRMLDVNMKPLKLDGTNGMGFFFFGVGIWKKSFYKASGCVCRIPRPFSLP